MINKNTLSSLENYQIKIKILSTFIKKKNLIDKKLQYHQFPKENEGPENIPKIFSFKISNLKIW